MFMPNAPRSLFDFFFFFGWCPLIGKIEWPHQRTNFLHILIPFLLQFPSPKILVIGLLKIVQYDTSAFEDH